MEITVEDIKPYLENISVAQKEKLLIQLLKKDKVQLEKIYFKYVANPSELDERYEFYEKKVLAEIYTYRRAMSEELSLAKSIAEAKKVINEFTKVDKRPEKEIELLMKVLEVIFVGSGNPARFGTCWTKYDLAVAQTLRRVLTILKKIHVDFHLNYKPQLDKYLGRIKAASSFNDIVYSLPDKFE